MSNHALPPVSTFGPRRGVARVGAHGRRRSARAVLRGWVERHVVAMDPTDDASRLDRLDTPVAQRRPVQG